jgi:hypothetical protein
MEARRAETRNPAQQDLKGLGSRQPGPAARARQDAPANELKSPEILAEIALSGCSASR